MSSESVRQLIDQAVAALQSGKHSQALELLDQAVQLAPESAEVYGLRGIAFAQLGRAEAATESLRKATMLEPSAKSFYNLAVHLLNAGEKIEALESVQEALKLDPNHAEAQQLMIKLAGTGAVPQFSVEGKAVNPSAAATTPRPGYGEEKLRHVFPCLAYSQPQWKAFGWTIVGLAAFSVILVKVAFPLQVPAKPDPKDYLMGYRPIRTPFAMAEIGFFITMILASMIWTSMDLIDRRGRALWMVPMMICCFLWMPFVPQALYMVAGRREQ